MKPAKLTLDTTQKAIITVTAIGIDHLPVPIPEKVRWRSTNPKVATVEKTETGAMVVSGRPGRCRVVAFWTTNILGEGRTRRQHSVSVEVVRAPRRRTHGSR